MAEGGQYRAMIFQIDMSTIQRKMGLDHLQQHSEKLDYRFNGE
jgi:hypothetical protein